MVLSKVYNNPQVRQYLPDFEKDATKRIPRQFLFSIVNKLDSDFFKRAIDEIERTREEKIPAKVAQQLNIKSELLAILRKSNYNATARKTSATSRSLQAMLTTTKTRKRQAREMETELAV